MGVWSMAGGPVFWLLTVMGVAAILLFAGRFVMFRRAHIDCADFIQGVQNVLAENHPDEALAICDEIAAPVAKIVASAVRHRNLSHERLRDVIDAAGRTEASRLERRIASIALIAQTAPLLGLLGTFLGLMRTLIALGPADVVMRVDVIGGALSALLPTAAGLVVAIPSAIMYSILSMQLDRIVSDMEGAASEMLAVIGKDADVAGGAS